MASDVSLGVIFLSFTLLAYMEYFYDLSFSLRKKPSLDSFKSNLKTEIHKMLKKSAIYYDKTQHTNFRGNPLS